MHGFLIDSVTMTIVAETTNAGVDTQLSKHDILSISMKQL